MTQEKGDIKEFIDTVTKLRDAMHKRSTEAREMANKYVDEETRLLNLERDLNYFLEKVENFNTFNL
jgi:hypothetical protein